MILSIFLISLILNMGNTDYNLMLQVKYMPNGTDDVLDIDNNAVSISSSRLSCRRDHNLSEFLAVKEPTIFNTLLGFPVIDRDTTDYLLFNCEGAVHPKHWGEWNDDTEVQEEIFRAMVKRMRIARHIYPNATIALGASIVPHKRGSYLPFMVQRIEGYRRAGEWGVFDFVDCLEPRMFIDPTNLHQYDIPEMFNMAMNVSDNVIKTSQGKSIDSCLTVGINHFKQEEALPRETMNEILLLASTYENIRKVNFWAGDFRRWYVPYLNNLSYPEESFA